MSDKVIQFPGSSEEKIHPNGIAKCEQMVGKVIRHKEFCISSMILFARKNAADEVEYLITTEEAQEFVTEEQLLADWEIVD